LIYNFGNKSQAKKDMERANMYGMRNGQITQAKPATEITKYAK